jgi:ferredoxin-NADP reductase
VGDVLQVKAPGGRFYLEPDPAVPAVFLGGGIGITPLLSMVRWALDEEPERELHLFYGVRDGDAHAFKRVLEELAAQHPRLHLHVLYSHPGPDDVEGRDFQHRGHLDVALVRRFVPDGRNAFYVCGPPPMMASLLPALRAWGVAPSDLHYEAFGPASGLAAEGTTHASEPAGMERVAITFRRSGRTLAWTGQDANLLDLAERNDLVVESGCRSGSCGGCETKLVSGTVGYARAPDHEVAPGCCLLCVGTPESALVLEA